MPLGASINNGRCTHAQVTSIWKASKRYQKHEAMQRTTIKIHTFNFRVQFCCDICSSHTTNNECFEFWNRKPLTPVTRSSRTTLKIRLKVPRKDWYTYNSIYYDTSQTTLIIANIIFLHFGIEAKHTIQFIRKRIVTTQAIRKFSTWPV